MTDLPYISEPESAAVDLDTAIMRLTLEQWLLMQGDRARLGEPYKKMENWDRDFIPELSNFARSQGVSGVVTELLVDNENELRQLVGSGWCANYIARVAAGDHGGSPLPHVEPGTLALLSGYRHAAEPVLGLHPEKTLDLRRAIARSIAESKKHVRSSTDMAIDDARSSAKIMGSMPIAEEAVVLTVMLELYALAHRGSNDEVVKPEETWLEQIGVNLRAAEGYLAQREEVPDETIRVITERELRIQAFAGHAKGVLHQVQLIEAVDSTSELDAYLYQQRRNAQILLTSHRRDLPWSGSGELAVMIRRNLFSAT